MLAVPLPECLNCGEPLSADSIEININIKKVVASDLPLPSRKVSLHKECADEFFATWEDRCLKQSCGAPWLYLERGYSTPVYKGQHYARVDDPEAYYVAFVVNEVPPGTPSEDIVPSAKAGLVWVRQR